MKRGRHFSSTMYDAEYSDVADTNLEEDYVGLGNRLSYPRTEVWAHFACLGPLANEVIAGINSPY